MQPKQSGSTESATRRTILESDLKQTGPGRKATDKEIPMNTKLHVRNLALTTTEIDLQGLFSQHGNVAEVNLPLDRHTRRPLGFAFITMATPQGALAAIQALNGKEVGAQALAVSQVPPRSNR